MFRLRTESEISKEIPRALKRRLTTPSVLIKTKKVRKLPSVSSSFQKSLLKYEKHLGYFCEHINKIHEDEYTDLTDLLENIETLDFSLAKRTSQLRPLAQLLNRLQMQTECASNQGKSLVHAEEVFKRSDDTGKIDDWEIEKTQPSQKRSTANTATRFVEFNKL